VVREEESDMRENVFGEEVWPRERKRIGPEVQEVGPEARKPKRGKLGNTRKEQNRVCKNKFYFVKTRGWYDA
jgi:hypothetical protein